MGEQIDSVVIGYHDVSLGKAESFRPLSSFSREESVVQRLLRRGQISVDGNLTFYLDALSQFVNRAADQRGAGASNLYTVAEMPNLGAVILASNLRGRGHSSELVNFYTAEHERFARLLSERDPRVVAITTTYYFFPDEVREITAFVRQHNRDTCVVVGGPLVDNICRAGTPELANQHFDDMGADVYVWEAQGEETLGRVVAAVKSGADLHQVPNLFLRDGKDWSSTGRASEQNDLDAGAVRWEEFSREELGTSVSTRTARSCAFKCAFCDYPARVGAYTMADLSTVEREMRQLARLGIKRVAFIDDTFNVPIQRFKDFCRMMIRNDFGIEWFSYFRCGNAQSEDIYQMMADSGCRGVFLGIETGDDDVLRNMNKKVTARHYRYGIEQLNKFGIDSHASLVVGYPGENEQTLRNTAALLNEACPTTWALTNFYYSHNAPVHQRAAEFGLSGGGLVWEHDSMSWLDAADAADELFEAVSGPLWLPIQSFDFWGVPYLFGKGMKPGELRELLRLARAAVTFNFVDGAAADAQRAAAVAKLETFCGSLELESARYASV